MQARIDMQKAAPGAIHAVLALETYIRKSSRLEPSLLELVRLRASQINGCAYCIDMHTKDARAEGETEQRLYALTAWRRVDLESGQDVCTALRNSGFLARPGACLGLCSIELWGGIAAGRPLDSSDRHGPARRQGAGSDRPAEAPAAQNAGVAGEAAGPDRLLQRACRAHALRRVPAVGLRHRQWGRGERA